MNDNQAFLGLDRPEFSDQYARQRDTNPLPAHLARLLLLRSLLWAGLSSLFHLIGLAQCLIGFCTSLCHAHSFPLA
jgi:hypothetical protein